MISAVPHYRIPKVFEKLLPILEACGTRIQGPNAGPDALGVFPNSNAEEVAAIARAAELAAARPFSAG